MSIQSLSATLLHGLGLIALIALCFGMIERSVRHPSTRRWLQGTVFGFGAIAAMTAPTVIGGGIMIDARVIIVGLSAAFCGWRGALPAAAFAIAYRISLGGAGAPLGITSIVMAVCVGLFWGGRYRYGRLATPRRLASLALCLSAHCSLMLLLPIADPLGVLLTALPVIVPAYLVGTLVMGSLMQRECRSIEREKALEVHALTDPLTGLGNRRAYQVVLEAALVDQGMAVASGEGVGLLAVDIDHFKRVNDTLGHDVGDEVLKSVALGMRATLTPTDYICRNGGEEFGIVLPSISREKAGEMAERLRLVVRALDFGAPGLQLAVTVSIGVAFSPDHAGHPSSLYAAADAALYRAKATGRDRVVLATDAPTLPRKLSPATSRASSGRTQSTVLGAA